MACDFPSVPVAVTVVSLMNQHPWNRSANPLVPAFLGRRARSRELPYKLFPPGEVPASPTDSAET